jgi:hypothetical protein
LKTLLSLLGAVAVVVGCSSDGSRDGSSTAGWPFAGRRSYDVTSTLTAAGGARREGPPSHSFTMTIDADARTAILGSSVAPFTVDGAGALRFEGSLTFRDPSWQWEVTYADDLTVRLAADGTLTGAGEGTGTTYYGDAGQSAPVAASLVGGPDVLAPALTVVTNGAADDPFSALTVSSPEALPSGVFPRLLGPDGLDAPFTPAASNGDFAVTFYGPALFRGYGRAYAVAVDGIADFAGHAATAAGATSFTTRPAPPLVPEDGFESASGPSLDAAQVLSGAEAPTITGARSLYIPPMGAPYAQPRVTRLALRLAVAPGDTVVRFAYRVVNASGSRVLSFVLVGDGGTYAHTTLVNESTEPPTTATLPDGEQVSLGAVATAELPLPTDVGSEVIVTEQVQGYGLGLPSPPVPGIIIDDLRVEP